MLSVHLFISRLHNFIRRFFTSVLAGSAGPSDVAHLDIRSKFTKVYEHNVFGGSEARSGEGSNLKQTSVIRVEVPKLIAELGVGTLLDAPCGDWHWMCETKLGVPKYIGVDIVAPMIQRNTEMHGSDGVRFLCVDIAKDELPKADLILTRDCLVHLSFEDAFRVLANFRRTGAMYLLATTFVERAHNDDLDARFWRPLNMQAPPFNFPAPLRVINEQCSEGGGAFVDKSLGLWKLTDVPAFERPSEKS